jgi:peptidoglycan/LPS O-acetylase OafA/YrhL
LFGNAAARSQLISIQLLRAIAALSVVVGHAITEIHQAGVSYPNLPVNFGIGVDIFFIVSGFVMVLTGGKLAGSRGAPLEFMWRRVIRVVPLYWLYTLAMLIAIWLFPSQLNNSSTSLRQVACSLLFLPCNDPVTGYHPVLSLGWTLNYEMFFYLLFAAALAFRPASAWFLRLWGLLLAALVAGAVLGGPFRFWGDAIILEFLAGAVIALLFQRFGSIRSATGFWVAVLTAGVLYFTLTEGNESRFISLGLPAILFAAGFVFALPESLERRGAGFAHFFGDSSYSLYLSHPFTLALVKMVWSRLDSAHAYPTAYLVVSLSAAVVGARLSYVFLEKPLTLWLGRRRKRWGEGQ